MSITNLKLKINFGSKQFIVNCNDLTYERALDLADRIAAVRMKNSLLNRFPMEERETREKWLARIEPQLEQDRIRKDGETTDDHLKRLFGSKIDSHEAAFDVTNAIAEAFSLQPVALEDFKKANFLQIKSFIYDVLNLADVPADEFFPKKPMA